MTRRIVWDSIKPVVILIAMASVVLLVAGCAQKSPYIRFGNAHKKTVVGGEVPIQHYVGIFDPSTNKPIGGLTKANFIVNVKGRTIEPDVLPSSNMLRDQLGIALVIDQGGQKGNWDLVKDLADTLLLEIGNNKDKAALMSANGNASKYVFEDPALVRGKMRQLAATGNGFGLTYPAIGEVKNSGREGLNDKSRVAIIAIVCGKPTGQKPELPEGVPLVIIDMSAGNDPELKGLAESSKGLYIPYAPNQTISLAKKALLHLKRQLADLYVINFRVKTGDLPLRYSLTYRNGSVSTTGDFIHDEWTQRYALIAGLATAIVAIVAIVFITKRKRSSSAASSTAGWSGGDYTIAGGSGGADDDATRAGMDASNFGGYSAPSYPAAQSSYSSMGGGSTYADAPPGGGGVAQSPGDVTAGAMDVAHPTVGGYGGSGGGYGGNAGDATVGDMAVVTPSQAGPSSMTTPLALHIETGGAAGRETRVTGPTKIGRGDYFASSFGTITLPGDPRVSREHAELVPENRSGATFWSIVNRSSTNKTYVNDAPIDGPRVLNAGDRIRVGETVIRVAGAGNAFAANDGDSTMR